MPAEVTVQSVGLPSTMWQVGLVFLALAAGLAGGLVGFLWRRGRQQALRRHAQQIERKNCELEALPAAAPSGYRVLLAEDNPVNQRITQRMLERAGCRVEAVSNGLRALYAVVGGDFDLVLMDVQMPEMDGFDATARIRRLESTKKDVPVVAMTANAMQGDRERCLAAGMNDYLAKPVRSEELRHMVRRWAAPARVSAAPSD